MCGDSSIAEKKVYRYTKCQQRVETKQTKYRKILQQVKTAEVVAAERTLSAGSCIKPDLDLYKVYLRARALVAVELTIFYNHTMSRQRDGATTHEVPIHRKLRLSGYIKRQQADQRLVKRLRAKFKPKESDPEPVFIMGNWSAPMTRFHEPIQGKGWRTLLKRSGFDVYLIDEYLTSKTCPNCFGMNKDSPSFQASSPTTTTTSPKHDAKVQAAEHDMALNNATALFGRGTQNQSKAELRAYNDAGSGSTVHGSPAREHVERLDHVPGALGHDAKETQIRTSLFDPHPIVVPPPGSRLSFAGANSPVMAHLLRALPSLDNTLQRQAQAPLCLYNYWQYLADIESGAEELEFWLAVSDYEAMHRQVAPTEANGRHRVESGALGVGTRGASARLLAQVHARHMDTFDTETQELDAYLARVSQLTVEAAEASVCKAHAQCVRSHRPFTTRAGPALDAPSVRPMRTGVRGFFTRILSGDAVRTRRLAPHEEDAQGSHLEPLLNTPMESAPTETEMRRAAELLYFHYVLEGAPASLHIGSEMRAKVAARIERDSRFDAQLFAPAKRHAYEAMRHESHVRFQRERLFHNITRGTAALRIVLGLALVMVALAFQVSLVLLDVRPKGWRWLPMAALWMGLAYAVAGVMRLDPFMAIMGRYEATAWSFGRVVDSTVRHAHLKRAAMIMVVTAGVSALITLVLFLVPGHRL
ncbi:hypothetical protein IW147_004846 [Coemansia sp. RSA 720]|nr:hypothetical protein IW147_004846 [Coemansia sp. RSA 720]